MPVSEITFWISMHVNYVFLVIYWVKDLDTCTTQYLKLLLRFSDTKIWFGSLPVHVEDLLQTG